MNKKLGELILYIASKSQDDRVFGATKLNKILFAIDFAAYGVWGHSISEATYVRREYGPCPKEILDVRDELIASDRAILQTKPYLGKDQKRLVALEMPDMSAFTEQERGLIDDLIDELKPLNATQLSEWTHTLNPWLSAIEGEEIPYHTVFVLQNKPASREGLNWAQERLKEILATGDLNAP